MTHMKLSKEGIDTLTQKLAMLCKARAELRKTLAESRQVKDADEFDIVDEITQLALLDKQIDETKHLISHSTADYQAPTYDGTIQIGSTVHLESPHGILQCKVVSPVEADPARGKISDASPLGSALLGKASQALVHVQGPKKSFTYRVLGIADA